MVICIYLLSNDIEIFAVFILVALREISFDLLYPVETRIIPLIVPKEAVAKLIGYRSVSDSIASLLGQAISGFVISLVGIVGGLILNSLTFFLSSILVNLLKFIQPPKNSIENDFNNGDDQSLESKRMKLKTEILEGVKILWNHDYLKKLAIIISLLNVVSMIGPIIVVYFTSYLNTTSEAYGVFNSLLTLGGLISGSIIGFLTKKHSNSTIILFGWSLLSVVFIVMAFNKVIWIIFINDSLRMYINDCLRMYKMDD